MFCFVFRIEKVSVDSSKISLLTNQCVDDYTLNMNCVNTVLGMHSRHYDCGQRTSESDPGIVFRFAKFQETLKYLRNIHLSINLSGVKQLSLGDFLSVEISPYLHFITCMLFNIGDKGS